MLICNNVNGYVKYGYFPFFLKAVANSERDLHNEHPLCSFQNGGKLHLIQTLGQQNWTMPSELKTPKRFNSYTL